MEIYQIIKYRNIYKNLKLLKERNNYSSKIFIYIFVLCYIFRIHIYTIVLCWENVKIYIKPKILCVNFNFFKGFCFHNIGHGKLKIKAEFKTFNKNNETIAVKYILKGGLVNKTILSCDKDENLFIRNNYLGIENYIPYNGVIYNNQPKRKIIKGIDFNDYLRMQSNTDKLRILKNFYNWLFDEFQIPNSDKISGDIVDCHFQNFIIDNNGHFHFIDRDVKLNYPFEKSYILYRSLKEPGLIKLYEYFLKYYGIEDKAEYYQKNRLLPLPENNENLKKAAVLNKDLINSIFKNK